MRPCWVARFSQFAEEKRRILFHAKFALTQVSAIGLRVFSIFHHFCSPQSVAHYCILALAATVNCVRGAPATPSALRHRRTNGHPPNTLPGSAPSRTEEGLCCISRVEQATGKQTQDHTRVAPRCRRSRRGLSRQQSSLAGAPRPPGVASAFVFQLPLPLLRTIQAPVPAPGEELVSPDNRIGGMSSTAADKSSSSRCV